MNMCYANKASINPTVEVVRMPKIHIIRGKGPNLLVNALHDELDLRVGGTGLSVMRTEDEGDGDVRFCIELLSSSKPATVNRAIAEVLGNLTKQYLDIRAELDQPDKESYSQVPNLSLVPAT